MEGNLDVCKILIQGGTRKFSRNNFRETPLDLAMQNNHLDLANIFHYLKKTQKFKKPLLHSKKYLEALKISKKRTKKQNARNTRNLKKRQRNF